MKNMGQMMKQMKQMKDKMDQVQKELETKEVVGTAGGGVVKVTMNGHKVMSKVEINPEIVDDIGMLQDLIVAANSDAMQKADKMIEQDMGPLTAGLNIPGL